MANKFATNYTVPGSSNITSILWKLTRVLKAAGWTYKASSDGYSKDTSAVATNDLWGGNADPMTDTYSSITTTVNSALTLPQSTITVVSTTGFASSGSIRIISSTGWQTVNYTGTTTTTFTGCTGGTGNIFIGNQVGVSSTFSVDDSHGWWTGSGPQTLKIPLSANPSGTFLRGEIVTQATSSAEGELIGYVWDTVGSSGWAVVLPHTGTFDNTHTITGSVSSATMIPTGTIVTYVREVTIYKENFFENSSCAENASLYYICADSSGESSSLFSTLAGTASQFTTSNAVTSMSGTFTLTVVSTTGFSSPTGIIQVEGSAGWAFVAYTGTTATTFTGCTLIHPISSAGSTVVGNPVMSGCTPQAGPGTGGTNNSFPSIALVVRGTGGSTITTNILGNATSFIANSNAQIGCANATPATGVSADGSFYIACSTLTANQMTGFVFTRLDDSEPGDVDPYIWWTCQSNNQGSWNRTVMTGATSTAYTYSLNNWTPTTTLGSSSNTSGFVGYQARGVSGKDVASGYFGGLVATGASSASFALLSGTIGTTKLLNHPATTPPIIREQMTIFTDGAISGTLRQIKGRCRWVSAFSLGSDYDTFDSKSWIVVVPYVSANTPCIALGPYDGSTQPLP